MGLKYSRSTMRGILKERNDTTVAAMTPVNHLVTL
jgi:hypothetical protein